MSQIYSRTHVGALLLLLSIAPALFAQALPAQENESTADAAAESAAPGEIIVTGQEADLEGDGATGDGAVTDTIDVEVVNVEVIVTDKTGQPIEGLTRDDFELLEDGQLVTLSNFYAARRSATSWGMDAATREPVAAPMPAPAAEGSPSEPLSEAHLILYVDNLNISPQNRKHLFESLREVLRERGATPSQTMLVVMNRSVEVVQPFTRDLAAIFAAIDEIEQQGSVHTLFDGSRRMFLSQLERASVRPFLPKKGAELDPEFDHAIKVALEMSDNVRALAEERYQKVEATLEALGGLCDTLGGLPGRKAVVYLSDGLPLRPADSLVAAWNGKYLNWLLEVEDDIRRRSRFQGAVEKFNRLSTSLGSSQFDLQSELNRLTTRANDNQVVFYPISKSGRSSDFVSAENPGSVDYNTASMRRDMQSTENLTRDSTLLRLAEDTGGVALLRSVHIGRLLEQVDRDFGSFYSLGYTPPRTTGDFRFHRLDVRVRHPQARVRHVKGYRNKSWRQRLGEKTAAAALYAFETNPLGVRLAPGDASREGDVYRVPIMVKIPFQQMRLLHQEDNYNAQLTVLVQVSDDRSGLSSTRRFDLPIKIPTARVLEVLPQVAAYPLELIIPEGPHRVAIGVRDHLARTEATVQYELLVGPGADTGEPATIETGPTEPEG